MSRDGSLPVFLVHWNAPDWLRSSTDTVLRSDLPVDVTVVDNGPDEASRELTLDSRVRVIRTGSNLGFAGAANVAIAEWMLSAAAYCVVGSHDLHVEPDTLRLLVEAADRCPAFGIIGPAVSPSDFGDLLSEESGLEARTWISGTCLLLRRSCVEEIGGFDEDLHSYCEDQEIGERANRHGFRVGRLTHARAMGLGSRDVDVRKRIIANQILLTAKRSGRGAAVGKATHFVWVAMRSLMAMAVTRDHRRAQHRRWASQNIRGAVSGLQKVHDLHQSHSRGS